MKYFLALLLTFNLLSAQSDVPLTLRAQFNGSYGYTIIGNTLNPADNIFAPSPQIILTQSDATLTLSANQNIVAAYLYWSGIGEGVFNPTIELNGISYVANNTVIGYPESNLITSYFGSFVDVTSQVIATGNGTYNFSNLDLNPIIGNYVSTASYHAGWQIVVVYEQIGLPNVQLNIYDGLNVISGNFNGGITPLTIDNLNVIDTNDAQLSYVVWNGTPNFTLNESISINGNILSNALNPPDNPFNATNTFTGSTTNWNQDIDTFDISSFISIGDTEANLVLTAFFYRFLQTIVTSIRSELPDATVAIDVVGGQELCNNRDLTVAYTVSNTNSNAVLPANVPVSIYADNVFLQTVFTPFSIPINGSLSITQFVSIPTTIPNTFTLKVIVDNTAANVSTVAESNENNNEATQIITLLGDTVSPTFSIATTFCQNATVPSLPPTSNNGISGSWLPNVISNQNGGSYVFTPNPDQCGLPFTLNVIVSNSILPTFSIPNTFCQNATVPTLPLVSSNNISGTWSPSVINNQANGSYLFTPNSGQCATSFTLNVAITPEFLPTFSIPTTFCQNATVPTLPLVSSNNISGTWSPSAINNQADGSYIFTLNSGQCATSFALNVTISPNVNPTFSLPTTFCQGATVPILSSNSDNGISGTWLPNVISNQTSGSYVFTPNAGQCANNFTLNITISPNVNPTFNIPTTFCQGATVPTLPSISNNNISGTWLPNVISNQNSGSYVFTQNAGQCNSVFTLNVTIETPDLIEETLFVCENADGSAVFPVTLNTDLTAGMFTFLWLENGNPIANNTSALTVFSAGSYEVVASPVGSGCAIAFEFEVSPLQPIAVTIETPPTDFDANPTLVVNVSGGSGQYLYSFDGLPFQSNPVFNVPEGGNVLVAVKDANGCYTFSETVVIWQYPRFFTPNNDTYNDTWGINTQKQITIEIFDRFGKFLKQLVNNERWDGTFNGQLLPSTDYWFVIYYDENKIFKSHFSLKR